MFTTIATATVRPDCSHPIAAVTMCHLLKMNKWWPRSDSRQAGDPHREPSQGSLCEIRDTYPYQQEGGGGALPPAPHHCSGLTAVLVLLPVPLLVVLAAVGGVQTARAPVRVRVRVRCCSRWCSNSEST